jgi:hypothetical protein
MAEMFSKIDLVHNTTLLSIFDDLLEHSGNYGSRKSARAAIFW